MSPARRPHFRRHNPPSIRLTDDDITIFRHLAKHRFLRATDLAYLLNRPYKKISERLAALYHNQYVDRPKQQLEFYKPRSREVYIYALGNAGARILAELDDVDASKVDWTDKNRDATRPFIKHTLLTADVMVALELATRDHPSIALIEPHLILARSPIETQRAMNPWKWQAKVTWNGQTDDVGLVPDRVFGLQFNDTRKRAYFFLEADRGTMPIARNNLYQSSMQKKFLGYLAGHRAKRHSQRYGIGNFRVLTITTSADRANNMIDNVKVLTGGRGSGLFLFAPASELRASANIFDLDLRTGSNKTATLID